MAYPYSLGVKFAPIQKNDQLEKRGAVIGGVIHPALTLIPKYILHYLYCNLHIVEPGGKSISTEVWDIVF